MSSQPINEKFSIKSRILVCIVELEKEKAPISTKVGLQSKETF